MNHKKINKNEHDLKSKDSKIEHKKCIRAEEEEKQELQKSFVSLHFVKHF